MRAIVHVYFPEASGKLKTVLDIHAEGKDEAERIARELHPDALAIFVLGWNDVPRDHDRKPLVKQ